MRAWPLILCVIVLSGCAAPATPTAEAPSTVPPRPHQPGLAPNPFEEPAAWRTEANVPTASLGKEFAIRMSVSPPEDHECTLAISVPIVAHGFAEVATARLAANGSGSMLYHEWDRPYPPRVMGLQEQVAIPKQFGWKWRSMTTGVTALAFIANVDVEATTSARFVLECTAQPEHQSVDVANQVLIVDPTNCPVAFYVPLGGPADVDACVHRTGEKAFDAAVTGLVDYRAAVGRFTLSGPDAHREYDLSSAQQMGLWEGGPGTYEYSLTRAEIEYPAWFAFHAVAASFVPIGALSDLDP